jgi:xanthine dehydrogenase/oxidase
LSHVRTFAQILIQASRIPELLTSTETDTGVHIGASMTWANIKSLLETKIAALPEHKVILHTAHHFVILTFLPKQTRVFRAVLDNLRHFAGVQIRNVGSIGGNIVTACTISDISPVLYAADATLHLMSQQGAKHAFRTCSATL